MLVACSSDDAITLDPPPAGAAEPGGSDPDEPDPSGLEPETPGDEKPPLYVVSTGVSTETDFVGYLATVTSLDAGTTFDLDDAAEIGVGAWIFNRPGDSSIYVASLADPTIVRWEVPDEGVFVERETLSVASLGVTTAYLAASAPIFSADKSYFIDDEQDQVVIWSPSRMELLGTIQLDDEPEGILRPYPEGAIVVHGDQLIITVYWRDPDDTTSYGDHVRVVTIDTNTDSIVDSAVERRVTHAAFNAESSDGTAYFTPYSLYAAYREIGAGHGAQSLAMRINPDEDTFDPNFSLDMSALVGGRPAGDFTLLDDETALLRVRHPEIVDPVDPEDWQATLWGEAGFLWWRWHVGDAEAVQIDNQEPGALGATVFKIDGKTYSTRYAADQSSTALVEITPAGEFLPSIEGTGSIVGGGVIRVR
jgi:hypothetical protein